MSTDLNYENDDDRSLRTGGNAMDAKTSGEQREPAAPPPPPRV